MENFYKDETIYDFVMQEESNYQLLPIEVCEGYEWSMYDHINKTVLYKNSQYETGNDNGNKPFKNIMRPMLNLQYRAEGFDVKDIVLFVNALKNHFKSFLVKKFHEKWARENEVDTFIDDMVESYVDFGGALIKDINGKKPEVVPLQRIAFCDQTDMLAGPLCEKHYYTPDQLKEMENKKWGNTSYGANISVDELITLSESYKSTETKKENSTPSKYVEIYELHGMMPESYLKDGAEENKYTRQMHIISFYKNDKDEKQGVTLYKGKESKNPYRAILRDKIYGRALGIGGAEELFEPQVWTNYSMIHIKNLLDSASKTIYQTTDQKIAKRQKINSMPNGQILALEDGKRLEQVNTFPVNLKLFENAVVQWEALAQRTASAPDALLGENPPAGTPFRLEERVVLEGKGDHEYRKGKMSTFLDGIYKDIIIPKIVDDINQGQEFFADCDANELEGIVDSVVTNKANEAIKEKILSGELVKTEEIELLKQDIKRGFMRDGKKKFIEILKDELKDAPIDVYVNIAGKQKNLAAITDKLVNVFRWIIANPAIMQDPRMVKLFNEILEYSGLSPIDFYQAPQINQLQGSAQPMQQPQQMPQQPAQALAGMMQ